MGFSITNWLKLREHGLLYYVDAAQHRINQVSQINSSAAEEGEIISLVKTKTTPIC